MGFGATSAKCGPDQARTWSDLGRFATDTGEILPGPQAKPCTQRRTVTQAAEGDDPEWNHDAIMPNFVDGDALLFGVWGETWGGLGVAMLDGRQLRKGLFAGELPLSRSASVWRGQRRHSPGSRHGRRCRHRLPTSPLQFAPRTPLTPLVPALQARDGWSVG